MLATLDMGGLAWNFDSSIQEMHLSSLLVRVSAQVATLHQFVLLSSLNTLSHVPSLLRYTSSVFLSPCPCLNTPFPAPSYIQFSVSIHSCLVKKALISAEGSYLKQEGKEDSSTSFCHQRESTHVVVADI